MAKGGAPAVILKSQGETIAEMEMALQALGAMITELGVWAKMITELHEVAAERLMRLESEVFGTDYSEFLDAEPLGDGMENTVEEGDVMTEADIQEHLGERPEHPA